MTSRETPTEVDPTRRLWTVVEPYHAVVYFGPEMKPAYEQAGLTGFWRGYFAGRAAPMGPVGAGVVTACFYGFHPDFVRRAVPDVWTRTSPAAALAARLAGVDRVLTRLGIAADGPRCGEAASLLRHAMEGCSTAGRPMYAANAELPWPDEPHMALWHATTLLREHRGDGHVVALVDAGLGPCEAHVLRIAMDGSDRRTIQPHRGWTDEDWDTATAGLRARGWLDRDGVPTVTGRQGHAAIERRTDLLAGGPVVRLRGRLERLLEVLTPVAAPLRSSGIIPYPNAMGVPPSSASTTG